MNRDEIAVLFSGGTDSTLAAATMQETFRRVHLVTYDRFGFHSTGNTAVNATMLQNKFGPEKFVHRTMKFDPLFEHLSYERYLRNWFKYGFFQLSTCGLCKLAMHARTIKYCLDHGVTNVCDGANMGMSIFPDQMKGVLDEYQQMYAHFGITYSNPVYFMTPPAEKSYIETSNLGVIPSFLPPTDAPRTETPGQKLHRLGLAPAPDVKGSAYDRKRQPRCHQLVLFNIFAIGYFKAPQRYGTYAEKSRDYFKDKIKTVTRLLDENRRLGKHRRLFA